MDYLKHWSLESQPFSGQTSGNIFLGAPQKEAIARLHYLIAGGMEAGLVLAEPDCGLTTLFRYLSNTTGFGDTAVQMVLTRSPGSDPADIYRHLAKQLHLSPGAADSLTVVDSISTLARQGVRMVWLADGATANEATVAAKLIDRCPGMTVLMGTRHDQSAVVCDRIGRLPLRLDLKPLSLPDSLRYIDWAMQRVRRPQPFDQPKTIFSDSALVRLHELGDGRMGWMGRIAEFSLMVGAANRLRMITTDVLELVQGELARAA